MTDDAKRVTSAVLATMKKGGDNLAIYEAVHAALAATPAVGGEALCSRLRAMPSSLNDACRTMEEAASIIEGMSPAAQEALRLLRKISDLAYDADVGEPLDCAIDYANKAIAVLTGSIE